MKEGRGGCSVQHGFVRLNYTSTACGLDVVYVFVCFRDTLDPTLVLCRGQMAREGEERHARLTLCVALLRSLVDPDIVPACHGLVHGL